MTSNQPYRTQSSAACDPSDITATVHLQDGTEATLHATPVTSYNGPPAIVMTPDAFKNLLAHAGITFEQSAC